MSMSLRLIDQTATHLIPTIATLKSAAADLRAALEKPIDLFKNSGAQVPTGVSVRLAQGYCGLILPRSGLASPPQFLIIPNAPGLIDEDFTGEIFVNLFNLGAKLTINPGDRIAQIICVERAKLTGYIDYRSNIRGTDGSGSTGVE